MSIFKAFLFTILLVAIETILTVGFQFVISILNVNSEYLVHYYEITRILTKLLEYFIILFLIFKLWFNSSNWLEKLTGIEWKTAFFVLLAILGFKLFSKPLYDIKIIFATINNIDIEPINHTNHKLKYALSYEFIRAIILAPILEELFFRKILFNGLLKKYSFVISIIVSSLLFAFIHIPNWLNLIPTFIFGIICCLIYIKTKNILYPILFHFIGNLISFLVYIYSLQLFSFQKELNSNWIYWLVFMIGIGITIFGLRKITTANKAQKKLLNQVK